jgi:16S rRNA (guanine(966)-N(2))-methyltransferase RsmD
MIYILGGKYKGKKLLMPLEDANLRPTKSIVRQAAVNMLYSRIEFNTASVVDICCGIGALGLEMLSRGAKHVTFVDIHTKWIKENIASLELQQQTTVVQEDLKQFTSTAPFDVIISDPPYKQDMPNTLLANPSLGKSGSLWLLEAETGYKLSYPQESFELLKQKRFGKSTLFLLQQL